MSQKLCLFKKLSSLVGLFVGVIALFFCCLFPTMTFAEEQSLAETTAFSEESSAVAIAGSTTPAQVLANNEGFVEQKEGDQTETKTEQINEASEREVVSQEEDTSVVEETKDEQNEGGRQSTDYSCGPAALSTWIKKLGGNVTEKDLMEAAKTNAEEGTTFLNLKNAAIGAGYKNAIVYKFQRGDINKITFPALVYLNVSGSDIGHYAVLQKIENNTYYLWDPQLGEITKTEDEFFSEFGQYAMVNGEIVFEEKSAENQVLTVVTSDQNQTASTENTSVSNQVKTITPPQTIQKTTATSDEELSRVKGKGWWIGPAMVTINYGARYVRIAYHGAHHTFRFFGKVSHIQIITWVEHVKNSHRIWRLPWK